MKISELESEIAQIEIWQHNLSLEIKTYMQKEDSKASVYFPQEIFRCTQERNMLNTHKDMRKVRINRLRLEQE